MSTILALIPQPPIHDKMPQTAETVFNIFIFIPVGIGLAIAVRQLIGGKGPLLLYCLIGGTLAATFEPIVDVLGLVYMKEVNAHGAFTILDRTMPWYIPFVYTWYVGGLGYLAYRLFENGITMKGLFALWALDAFTDLFLETPGLLMHTYLYYGHQPFNIWGFPMWWAFVNPVMPMTAGAIIYAIKPHIEHSPWLLMAAIPVIPMADGIANAAAGFPMWIALNQTDVSYVWTYLASFVTLGLSLFCVWLCGLVVAKPETEVVPESIFAKLKALFSSGGGAARPAASTPIGTVA